MNYNKVGYNALAGKHNSSSILLDCTIWTNSMGKDFHYNEENLAHVNPYKTFLTSKK